MPRILETLAGLWSRPAMPDAALRSAVAHEEKASATGPLILLETLGRPVWTPRDYEAFAREGFMQNAIVYRAVRMIAEAAASVPLLLYEGDDEQEHQTLLDLLARPSIDQTGTDFLEAWYGYLLVAGNAYVEAVALDGKLRELHALRPDRMKVVPGAEGWPEAYEYTCAGRTIRFEEEPVSGVRAILHVRLFHPVNDHYGMSPIEAAAQAIDIHNTAGRWNKALLDNSARPSGALVYGGADGRMSPEQFERLKAELEDGFQGPKRAGRPLLLEGGLDWKPLSLSPKDMDFIAARNGAAREIALAFGVPPMLLGIPGDNTFSNYQEAQRAFWRSTVLPLVTRTAKALASWLAPAWNTSLELRPDLDQIEALTSEREALWARIEKVSFLTLNEKRAAVGYTPLEEPPPAATESEQSSVLRKYRPGQARAPRGDADGGQWVDEGGGSGGGSGSRLGTSVASGVGAPRRKKPTEAGTQVANRAKLLQELARRLLAAKPKVPEKLPDFLTKKPTPGKITGKLDDVTPDERRFFEEMRDLGNEVDIVPRGAGRTPDVKLNGKPHELKTVSGVKRTDEEGLSSAISSRILDARGQARDIVVNARDQAGWSGAFLSRTNMTN